MLVDTMTWMLLSVCSYQDESRVDGSLLSQLLSISSSVDSSQHSQASRL